MHIAFLPISRPQMTAARVNSSSVWRSSGQQHTLPERDHFVAEKLRVAGPASDRSALGAVACLEGVHHHVPVDQPRVGGVLQQRCHRDGLARARLQHQAGNRDPRCADVGRRNLGVLLPSCGTGEPHRRVQRTGTVDTCEMTAENRPEWLRSTWAPDRQKKPCVLTRPHTLADSADAM